jgi:hypothetical protein
MQLSSLNIGIFLTLAEISILGFLASMCLLPPCSFAHQPTEFDWRWSDVTSSMHTCQSPNYTCRSYSCLGSDSMQFLLMLLWRCGCPVVQKLLLAQQSNNHSNHSLNYSPWTSTPLLASDIIAVQEWLTVSWGVTAESWHTYQLLWWFFTLQCPKNQKPNRSLYNRKCWKTVILWNMVRPPSAAL